MCMAHWSHSINWSFYHYRTRDLISSSLTSSRCSILVIGRSSPWCWFVLWQLGAPSSVKKVHLCCKDLQLDGTHMYSKQDNPSRIFSITHCLPGDSTPKLQQGNCWEISVTIRLFLKKTITVGLAPIDGKHHGKNNNQKSNNNNNTTVGLILNSKRQNSTVVKNAVSRGRTLDFKS